MRALRTVAPLTIALLGFGLFGTSCGSGSTCGLGLVGRSRPFAPGNTPFPALEPGESAFKDVKFSDLEGLEIDLLNESTPQAPVDVFLTTQTCDKLFAAPYLGAASTPLCKVYYGPVPATRPRPPLTLRSVCGPMTAGSPS